MSTAFDRASIFRSAHQCARRMLTWGCFKGTYRQAFAIALKEVWYAEREAIAEAAYQATLPPIPADVADRIRELREDAWASPITRLGNERHAALLDQARDLADAAREAAVATGELHHAF